MRNEAAGMNTVEYIVTIKPYQVSNDMQLCRPIRNL